MIPDIGNVINEAETVSARDLYPVNDAAYRLGVTPRKVWALIKEGRIDTKRLDGRRLIPADALADFISSLPNGEEQAA
ncbi:helix-turn-helix domain-containing protein [Micromonospora sp. NPDC050417]|uniref:helix-turn-helix domain-containing protein n=1 Tax=Micromonospora sp. NPDC050417 TaxID=3364280 RepID=UPI003794022E